MANKKSKRRVTSDILLITHFLFILIPLLFLLIDLAFNSNKLLPVTILLIRCHLIIDVLLILYICIKGGFRKYFERYKLINLLEESLISSSCYLPINENIVDIPKISIDSNNEKIILEFNNAFFLSKLSSIVDTLSGALPSNMRIRKHYFSSSSSILTLEYEYADDRNRYVFDEYQDFIDKVNELPKNQLLLDKKTNIDLGQTPHLLFTGKSGSGKSYTLYGLIAQMIQKDFDVSIIDYKKTYWFLENKCKLAFEIEDIVKLLNDLVDELHVRQEQMKEFLKEDPNAIAIDHGFIPKIIIIEEYLSIVHSGVDKKILNDIEKKITELVLLGRQLSIHVIMSMQQSSATDLPTSIRSQLTPLVLGSASKSIYETAFGIGNAPKVNYEMSKGEGIGAFEGQQFFFRSPTFNFSITRLIEVIIGRKKCFVKKQYRH